MRNANLDQNRAAAAIVPNGLDTTGDLPFRQIHLDFHTSEHIPDVGSLFDPERFVSTLKTARVNSVTLFAKCHHGWCYYPTAIGSPHPNLSRPDLLGEMVEACRKENIETPIYITAQWDELTARTRPDLCVVSAATEKPQPDPTWHPVSLANPCVVEHIAALTQEVIERYDPQGIFTDILLYWEDICAASVERMLSRGLNPERQKDRLTNDREIILEYYERISVAAKSIRPSIRVFHNSGHIFKNERERYQSFTHFEIESLPTGGWGYDHFPISARYANLLGKQYVGQTGKFHTWWGDFGGYKRPVALEYECCLMAALGARCAIGDQLHPNGRIDEDTYKTIEPAYRRIETLEPYLVDAEPVSEIAVFSSEGHVSRNGKNADDPHDAGCCRMLLESQIMFDVIDEHCDFARYAVIILPDSIVLEPGPLLDKLLSYHAGGGKLLLSGRSGMSKDLKRFLLPLDAEIRGPSRYTKEYLKTDRVLDERLPRSPFILYEQAMNVFANQATSLGDIHEPHFNRSKGLFCSHQHTPYKNDACPKRHGILISDRIAYFAHPICKEYRNSGQPLVKYAFIGALKRLLGRQLQVTTTLPSSGRLSLMRQPKRSNHVLHLLFAQPQSRGGTVNGAHGLTTIEIIEDIVPIHDIEASLALPQKPARVYSAYSGKDLPSSFSEGRLTISLSRLYLHEAIVIE